MSQALASRASETESELLEQLDRWYSRVHWQSAASDDDRMPAHAIIALVRTLQDGEYYSRPLMQAYGQFERQLKRGPASRDALEGARMALLCAIDMARSNLAR